MLKSMKGKTMESRLSFIAYVLLVGSMFIASGCWRPDEVIETPRGAIMVYRTARRLDPLASTFVPRGAVNVRMYYRGGFGGQSYSVSCHVSQKDLDEFARKGGYSFSPRAFDDNESWTRLLYLYDEDNPVLCDAPKVRNGLPVNHHFDGYLVGEKEYDGRHYQFLYDKRCEMLYVHYFD